MRFAMNEWGGQGATRNEDARYIHDLAELGGETRGSIYGRVGLFWKQVGLLWH